MKKVSLHTLGCKLNYAEGETMLRSCKTQGYEAVAFGETADLILINTCSVTEQADQKCRSAIAKARRVSPKAAIVVTGCYAQLQPHKIAALAGVDHVVGTKEKFKFVEDLSLSLSGDQIQVSSISKATSFLPAYSAGSRTRAFLKVQDGCDYGCSFCTIPLARGKSRSSSVDEICAQATALAAQGIIEVVLSGVNIGDFRTSGQRSSKGGLLTLLCSLSKVPKLQRFRISSIEPNLLSEEIIRFVAEDPRWMPHFHVPLQSGSDRILQKMRRRYTKAHYKDRIDTIRARMPDACVGVDVIVGFPGETDKDFRQTYDFLQELNVQYLHVFPYAERPSTIAANMQSSVPLSVRRERAAQLRNLSLRKQSLFYRDQLGSTRSLLLEKEKKDNFWIGFTENYLRAALPISSDTRPGQLHKVQLQTLHKKGFIVASPYS